ncbi:hypothetical protein HJC23_013163 [Cyclotella cryptica]|uniref:MEKHLA domain-containing protein n=1 Tax=Cyclotella cryptica TaxID=29204 RepID=A0ABD3QNQ0_9STRA|eukprot:CCRYP_003980-RA/>CCRYP_003980-RA protein AED:0.14 eAED:0.14 QI:177/1/1/1/0.33/0.3/10/7223/622
MRSWTIFVSHSLVLSITTTPSHPFTPPAIPLRHNNYGTKSFPLQSSKNAPQDDVPAVYPLSQRKALLIQEASRLDPSIAKDGKGSYSPIGWSNRLGAALTPAAPDIYTADRPFYWNKIDVGCRMTVVRLSNNDLVVHSPIGLDPPLLEALNKLNGNVVHVISPNYEHVKYAKSWGEHFTTASMWGCPGLMEREPQVRWTGEIEYHARPVGYAEWSGVQNHEIEVERDDKTWDRNELQPLHIDVEVNPFTGRPFFNEVIFYHPRSKTLLVTDLYWNYPRGDGVTNAQVTDEIGVDVDDFGVWELAPSVGEIPLGSRAWKVGMDKLFRPFYNNFMIKSEQRDKFQQIARFVTCGDSSGGWEVETIIPAHGDIVRGKELCRKVLERHFNIRCDDDCRGSLGHTLSEGKDNADSSYLEPHYTSKTTLEWLQKMALSYKLEKGEDLLEVLLRESSNGHVSTMRDSTHLKDHLLQLAKVCAQSHLPIASHDFLRDPTGMAIYNYGNRAFLDGFGYEWDEFVELPSKKCVETEAEVEERQMLLDAVKEDAAKACDGTSSGGIQELTAKYDNLIRVRKDRRKILLKGVNLWNVYNLSSDMDLDSARNDIKNGDMKAIGQAVWIKEVEYLV